MSRHDREHFEAYREQTRVKHEILAAYLPAFLNILKRWQKNLVYIDAFAGSGTYVDKDSGASFDGSPIRALSLIAGNDDFAKKTSAIFIERDHLLFEELRTSVAAFYADNDHIREPQLVHGTFAEGVTALLDHLDSESQSLAPCFLFIDPCGVEGASFEVIQRTMDTSDACELFMFFNIDGVRRIAGLDRVSPVLVELFGDEAEATDVYNRLRETENPQVREELILGAYRAALMDRMATPYVIAFRVEFESRRATSHYLIHATRHPLGFQIMKDVMWKRGQSSEGGGGLGFVQASQPDTGLLIRPEWHEFRESIVADLADGSLKVDYFCTNRVQNPDDLYCKAAYKKALLELEAERRIVILGKDSVTPTPSEARPKRKGPTLGDDYYVTLP